MEMTDRQPRPQSGLAWVLMIAVTVIALIVGAVGESLLAPQVAPAVSTAKGVVSNAITSLSTRVTAMAEPTAPSATTPAPSTSSANAKPATAEQSATTAQQAVDVPATEPYVAVVQKAGPAVVTVVNQLAAPPNFFGQFGQPEALGSGVIIDKDG